MQTIGSSTARHAVLPMGICPYLREKMAKIPSRLRPRNPQPARLGNAMVPPEKISLHTSSAFVSEPFRKFQWGCVWKTFHRDMSRQTNAIRPPPGERLRDASNSCVAGQTRKAASRTGKQGDWQVQIDIRARACRNSERRSVMRWTIPARGLKQCSKNCSQRRSLTSGPTSTNAST